MSELVDQHDFERELAAILASRAQYRALITCREHARMKNLIV